MSVIVDLFFMSRMHMIVRAVLVPVVVAVVPGFPRVFMAVLMLVTVLVGMAVGVLGFSVRVFMLMRVNMFVRMQMLVFMVAVHCKLLSFGVDV